jgi:hypothetical protein
MTASRKPKTPSMNLEVVSGVSAEDVDTFCKRASRLTMSQVVNNVTVTEAFLVNGEARHTRFTITIAFFPKKEYEAEYDIQPSEILAAFASKFPLMLKKEMQSEMKKLDADLKSQIADLGKGKNVKVRRGDGGDGDGDGENESVTGERDDDDQSDVGDGDAEDWKQSRRKQHQTSYESDDEDEDENEADEYSDEAIAVVADTDRNDFEDPEVGIPSGSSKNLQKRVKVVARHFVHNMQQATSFKFTETGCTFQIEVRQFFEV